MTLVPLSIYLGQTACGNLRCSFNDDGIRRQRNLLFKVVDLPVVKLEMPGGIVRVEWTHHFHSDPTVGS